MGLNRICVMCQHQADHACNECYTQYCYQCYSNYSINQENSACLECDGVSDSDLLLFAIDLLDTDRETLVEKYREENS